MRFELRLPQTLPGAEVALPPLVEVEQTFPRPRLADVAEAVREGLRPLMAALRGRRIAVTAGSRGIRDIVPALQGAVQAIRDAGAEPVVLAAMGSHGGGTAEGQLRVLTHLGITAQALGAPVISSMEVVELGRTPGGYTVYLDRRAAECHGVIVLNRIKPHTAFIDRFGSGLLKMLAIGLGKAPGAAQAHRQGAAGIARCIEEVAGALLESGRVVAGVAMLENAYDETAAVEVLPPAEIPRREPLLYRQAQEWMPRLPVEEADVLVVREMGKNYSGTGMDPNIIGRWRHPTIPDPPSPRFHRIVALRLSPASAGNAQGVGLADVVTAQLAEAIDFAATYLNAITSTFLERVFLPLVAPSDRTAIQAALGSLDLPRPEKARLVLIPNTLHLERLWVSESLTPALAGRPGVTIGPPRSWKFTAEGDLVHLR
ncbi:MAG: lactate racemase domain-containing protein [Armatimonadota bacterium]|nr:lactate racemase domain-containing protein [Armatimonadota bacterium]MDR7427485.1 lactate racemase domain-containing protein [Armatimonadota bacterium]MDR7463809.1 lactate racemase domain-containing protein [Armatimonadota bacterium]MDR7469955.1 lactate racemase domain-containing protein [Armatimonadota bacterium]MDR7474462.1 lactate racemase domain-containing protein [Armatimonadota bacterium]